MAQGTINTGFRILPLWRGKQEPSTGKGRRGDTVKLYEVNYETDQGPSLGLYDIVIIATPLAKEITNIKFLDFDLLPIEASKPYQQTVATFVHGQINASFFESESPKSSDTKVWKIFSPEPLTDEQLRLLFESYHAVIVKKWLAYPQYNPPEKLPPIILHHDIYYLNSIELAASAMEMCAISAKNIALLSYHRWYGQDGQIDQEDLAERLKSEL
ncbi:unnamed protein product [Ranitomeya imitator]|uniref:Prenylcysteine oxidase 1 n=1 Tax=Ranitomeya imitator TaxID=111125 RepID=A0ABN9MFK7_9NEOB|nr:unnamed protein product [Ranitomeya imitator]